MRISQRSQQHFLLGGIAVMFLLIGCGNNAGSGASPSPTGMPPTLTITLQASAASYRPGSVISATIKNQSTQAIYFADHRTNCTVLLLERQVPSSWEPVALCKLMIMTRIHSLKAGEILEVKLTTSNQWATGIYRTRLDYSFKSDTGIGAPTIVYSSLFRLV